MYEETIEGLRKIVQEHKGRLTPYMRLTICKAADAIEELSKSRWIPVTERLPETQESILGKKSSKVIVAFHFDDGTQGTDTAHTLNGKWVFEDHIVVVARTITHWRPLPKPPKEEEND